MFSFITKCWNPIVGCPHQCVYCWARKLAETRLSIVSDYYKDFTTPKLIEKRLKQKFKPNDFVFVSDMGDAWSRIVDIRWQAAVVAVARMNPETTFLYMTKDPYGYVRFEREAFRFPDNVLLGITIETNRDTLKISHAPMTEARYLYFRKVQHKRKFVSIEPIMDFDLDTLVSWIKDLKPEMVAAGYDNYKNGLVEPTLEKTNRLIVELGEFTKVYIKTLHRSNPHFVTGKGHGHPQHKRLKDKWCSPCLDCPILKTCPPVTKEGTCPKAKALANPLFWVNQH